MAVTSKNGTLAYFDSLRRWTSIPKVILPVGKDIVP